MLLVSVTSRDFPMVKLFPPRSRLFGSKVPKETFRRMSWVFKRLFAVQLGHIPVGILTFFSCTLQPQGLGISRTAKVSF